MTWVLLTIDSPPHPSDGNPVAVNLSNVGMIQPSRSGGSLLRMVKPDEYEEVKETMSEIFSLIAEPEFLPEIQKRLDARADEDQRDGE